MPSTWHARPVFISSTFKDMQAERDWLQHHVFPRVEERLRERRHHLEPIDLRLGVETARAGTEEARELLVLKVCLDEIKRSRPFLLVLLGDRYGWVPPKERMDAAAREQGFKKELAGKSVTALEIEFGIFKEDPGQKQRSLFFFRRSLPYDTMTSTVAEAYCDARATDPAVRAGATRLEALKEKLSHDDELESRVFDYTAEWDENAQRVTGLEAFGELVYEKLWAALEEETRAHLDQPPATWHDEERAELSAFCEHRCRNFVGRTELVTRLLDLATEPERKDDHWGACVISTTGTGKSALFAELYLRLDAQENVLVLANAAGGTQRGSQVAAMLLRWIGELAAQLNTPNPLPEDPSNDDLDEAFRSLLYRASDRHRVVVLLDALDQFESSTRGRHLTWLNGRRMPENARLIATALPGTAADALCQWAGVREMALPALTQSDATEIGRQVWQRYHREISPEVLDILIEKRLPDGSPAAGNPLWLTLALEQLNLLDADDFIRAEREFTGSPTERMHAMIMDTAVRIPPDIADLYGWLLARNEKVFGAAYARAFSVAISLSRFGWRVQDLQDLVPRLAPLLTPDAPAPEPDDLKLAALRRGFRAHLMRRGQSERLDYVHGQMRLAVQRNCRDEGMDWRSLHSRISDYLETLDSGDEMIRIERMRHLIGERNPLRAARYYAGLDTSGSSLDAARIGSSWTLVEWISQAEIAARRPDDSKANENLGWLVGWLEQEDLSQDEVFRLTNNFQFGLLPKLENEVGLHARGFLIRKTQDALKRLTAADPSNALWQGGLSLSHEKIGDVLVTQGDLSGGLNAYRECLGVAERLAAADPSNAGWQRDLGASQTKIGNVLVAQGNLSGGLNAYRESLGVAERLTAADPSNASWQGGLSLSHEKIGDVLVARGDLSGGLNAYRESLGVRLRLTAVDPSNAIWQRDLTVSLDKLGDVLVARGDLVGGLNAYRESLEIRERLAAVDPSNALWQRDLLMSHNKLGDVLVAQGDLVGGLNAYRQCLGIAEQLTVADPSNAAWQRDLMVSQGKIGNVLIAQGDLSGGLNVYRECLAITEGLAASDPSNTVWQRDLGVSQEKIGDVLVARGDLSGGLNAYRESLRVAERLVASDPSNAGSQRDLLVSHIKLGDMLVAQRDLTGGLNAYRESLGVAERLAASDPSNADSQRDLLVINNRIGDVLVAQGDLSGGLNVYRACLGGTEGLVASDPSNAAWQRDLSVRHNRIGDVLVAQGDLSGGLEAYRACLGVCERLAASDPPNAAWQRDLLVSYFKIVTTLDKTDSKTTDIWLKKAYEQLSRMKQKGMFISDQDEAVLRQLSEKLSDPYHMEVSIPSPHPVADIEQASRLNTQYQEKLSRWKALPWWKRIWTTKPEKPKES